MEPADATVLQAWIEKSALRELVARVAAAVDRADHARIVACYTDDSFDDHGVFKGSGRAFADFICGPGFMPTMHHLLGQSVFDVDGDEAWGETYFAFEGTYGTTAVSGYGRYVDYFRRIDGAWKLHYRRVVPDTVPEGDIGAYWTSTRDATDPTYDRRRGPEDEGAGE
jgi:ketosteroid isomerase-like protein